VLHWAALACYLAATGIFLGFVFSQGRRLHQLGRLALWLGFGLHTLALVWAWLGMGALPAYSLRSSLDLFSWALVGATVFIGLRIEVKILGAFAAPLAALLMLAAAVLPQSQTGPPAIFKNLWLILHVFTTLGGYGLLALTFLSSLLYLLQDNLIRAKRLGAVFKRLPSLDRLDHLSHTTLITGFALMTLGMLTGAIYAQILLGSYWRWDPKEVWSLITWLLYAALLHTRLVSGWRGRRGAWLSLVAFCALLFTYLGASQLMPGYHRFESFPTLGGPQP
jgi:cytochrome c-type biogenesis protein CcsB